MKKITLTRNGQTEARDVEVSTMHPDGLKAGDRVMLRIKGDCLYKGPTEYQEYKVDAVDKSDRYDGKSCDIRFVKVAKAKVRTTTAVATVEPVKAALTDNQAADAIRKQYQVVIRAEAASFRERVRFGGMLLQWERFLGESRGGAGGGAGDGLKGWLEKNCPEIGYAAAMGYKTMAERAIKMLGGGAAATAALLGESEVTQPDGEVIDVPAEIIEKRDALFAECDSRRKLEQMWFEFTNGEGKPGKKRSKGLDVGDESAPALTAAQEAHAEWSRLFVLKPRFSKMMRLAKCLTFADASDALELLRPLMDSLRARVKEK